MIATTITSLAAAYSNAGRGWVMVKAEKLHPHALIENMEAGNFYATTGVVLKNVTFEDNVLSVKVKPEAGVDYQIQFIGAQKDRLESKVLETVKGPAAEFKVTEDYLFVRAKIISSKIKDNPYREGDVEVAWVQPYKPAKK